MPSSPLMPHKVHSDTHIFTKVGSNGPTNLDMRKPDLNIDQKMATKTMADFKLRAGVKPIRRLDVSDAADVNHDNTVKVPSFGQETQALALTSNRTLPPHLLLASLLEELCFIYVKDRNKAQHLFKILCERLSKLEVMAPLSHLDEMSGLRYQRRTMLNKLIRAAMRSMEQSPSLLALPDPHFSLNFSSLEEDVIEQQTSRYKNEFQELGILGKGGFGSVFKARNYLDGCEYAVKKVRFKHKNTDLELKLLREVKALANLQHTNIVGYNAAWMEYDSPYLTSKVFLPERSCMKGQQTDDSDSDTADSVQFDNQDSMSVEFCLSDDHIKPEVKSTPAISVPGGLAMNAKLFSTVHKQVVAPSAGTKTAACLSSEHTHLNENHNRSSSEDSVVFVDSGQSQESRQKSLKIESMKVKRRTSRSPGIRKKEQEANYFPVDVKNYKEYEPTYYYGKELDLFTETHKGSSKEMISRGLLQNTHNLDENVFSNSLDILHFKNVDENLLGNSSFNSQFHNIDDNLCSGTSAKPQFENLSDSFLHNPSTISQFHYETERLLGNLSNTTIPQFPDVNERLLCNLSTTTIPKFPNGNERLLCNLSTNPQFPNENDSLLGNSSAVPQFHQVSVEGRQDNGKTTELLTSRDVFTVPRQTDSVQCALGQGTSHAVASLSADNQMDILNTAQVRNHWCSDFSKFSDQKCQCTGVQLPSDFISICQQALSSVVIDLKEDHNLHQHQENVSVAKLDYGSCMPADHQHYVLKTASQAQNLNSTPSDLLIFGNRKFNNSELEISSSFPAAPSSVTPKASFSQLHYNNKAAKINPEKTTNTKKPLRHSPTLSQTLSQNQQVNSLHEATQDSNIFMSHASNIDEPLSKTSITPLRVEKSGNRQAGLRRGPLVRVSFRSDCETEEVLESRSNYVFQNSITLYIQMELCTFTLQEWMTQRNSEFHLKGYDDVSMCADNIRVFHQILQGVDFIHANGLIHRDLKPRNIFLSGSDLHVKIGDFGLATGDALKSGKEDLVLAPLSSVTPLVFDSHTGGVGTSAYASPEQLNGSNYDFKSDMYSLGVMLYEMFHVFVTEMERVQEIQQLRRGNKCSPAFRKRWPLEAETVEALTNPVASMRPAAQDVLNSKLFLSHEQQVKMLQRKLLEQQKQLERLHRDLQEKDRIISQLRREQREKTLAEEFNLFL